MKLTVRQISNQIALGAAVVFCLVVVGFGLSFYSHYKEERNGQRVVHTYQVIHHLKDISNVLSEAEAGVRGYSLTSGKSFLSNYYAARQSLPNELSSLNELVSDNPSQQRRIERLQVLIEERMQILDRQVATKTRGELTAIERLVFEGSQKAVQVKALINEMVQEENRLLARRNLKAANSYRLTNFASSILLLLIFIVLFFSYQRLRIELSRREANEAQLRAYEATLEEKVNQLERSNEDLLRFAYVASHDLQEPLRKIQTYTSLLQESIQNDTSEEARQYLDRIQQAGARSTALIRDLLTYSRVSNQKEQFKPVNLQALVKDLIEELDFSIAENKAHIKVGKLPEVEAMPGQIRHLFQNLLTNSLKYRQPGIEPDIRIESCPVNDGAAYEISIADNGIGFDEKYTEQIFEPFKRLHNGSVYKGTGIGLAICKKVVMSHGGSIHATSQIGKGSRFTIVLPRHNSEVREAS